MMDSGFAYLSKETPIEEGQRDEVIRFRIQIKRLHSMIWF